MPQPVVNLTFKTAPASLPAGSYSVNCTLRNTSSGAVLSTSAHALTRVADGE